MNSHEKREQAPDAPNQTTLNAPGGDTALSASSPAPSNPMESKPGQSRKAGSVVTYLAVLFAAAFLLLLLAYFMQQRTNEVAIGSLTESITSIESLDDLIEENRTLREENETLTTANETLTADKATLEEQLQETTEALEEMEMQWTALRTLEELERLAGGSRTDREQAAERLTEYHSGAELLDGESLKFWLDQQSEQEDEHSPAARYDALLETLDLAED